jgi:hypothetical protein
MKENTQAVDAAPRSEKELHQRFEQAADRIAAMETRPTLAQLEEYFKISREVPTPKYWNIVGRERAKNTKRYQAAVKESERLIGSENDA